MHHRFEKHHHVFILKFVRKVLALKYTFNFVAVWFVILNLAGCASSGVVENASPIWAGGVSLDLAVVETSSSLINLKTEKVALNNAVISCLRQRAIFGVVSPSTIGINSDSGVKIKTDIKQIKTVSDKARLWFGGLAGRAEILAQVTVTDLNSGRQIATFEAEGKSGKSARSGTTEEAIELAAERISAEMVKISMQTSQ
jgi:hypothetical protein